MASAEEVLGKTEYANYRNVRAVALLFVVVGFVLVLGGAGMATGGGGPERRDDIPPAVGFLVAAVGLTGVVGGVATRRGNRAWAPLVKVMACIYLLAIPIGTILGLALLTGFSKYLTSMDRLRRAESGDEDWDEDWDDGGADAGWR